MLAAIDALGSRSLLLVDVLLRRPVPCSNVRHSERCPHAARLSWLRVAYQIVKSRLNLREEPGDDLVVALETCNYKAAMEILVGQYGDDIHDYCKWMLRNADEVQDVWQTVFAQALQSLKGLSSADGARMWLRGIARHRCLDQMRARRRRPQIVDSDGLREIADQQIAFAPADNDPCISRALDECLDCLDARSRALLKLRFHHDLTFGEISKLTFDTPGALRVRLARALPALRRCLENKGCAQHGC